MDWNEEGEKDAENEKPRRTEGFPDDNAKDRYNEGFNNKWWEKGNNDAKLARNKRQDLPNDRDLVLNYSEGYDDCYYADADDLL